MKNLFLLILCFQITLGNTQHTDSIIDKPKEIDKFFNYLLEHKIFSGSVLVKESGKILLHKEYGWADFDSKTHLTKDAPFYIASVSKQFTTMAIMMLKERGLLKYDNLLADYFSDFPNYAKKITIRHLMTNTSGVPNNFDLGLNHDGMTNQDVFDVLVKQKRLDFKPGTNYKYSNSGFILLAMIVEKITEMRFSKFVDEYIFKPLGMNNSYVQDHTKTPTPKMVNGHDEFGLLFNNPFFMNGAGGIYSTTYDLSVWDEALYTDKLVSQKSIREAYRIPALPKERKTNYGFGWRIVNKNGNNCVFHTGGLAGYVSFIFRDLTNRHTIIFTANQTGFDLGAIADALTGILYEKDYSYPKIPISMPLNKLIKMEQYEKILDKYESLKGDSTTYIQTEDDLNEIGYALMHLEQYQLANKVFEQNIQAYPQSWNPYDSYAESFLKLDDLKKAKMYYQKSIELNNKVKNKRKAFDKLWAEMNQS